MHLNNTTHYRRCLLLAHVPSFSYNFGPPREEAWVPVLYTLLFKLLILLQTQQTKTFCMDLDGKSQTYSNDDAKKIMINLILSY